MWNAFKTTFFSFFYCSLSVFELYRFLGGFFSRGFLWTEYRCSTAPCLVLLCLALSCYEGGRINCVMMVFVGSILLEGGVEDT